VTSPFKVVAIVSCMVWNRSCSSESDVQNLRTVYCTYRSYRSWNASWF